MQIDGYDINTLYETLKQYPRLKNNLPLLYKANKDYNAIKAPGGELEQLYKQLPYPLTEENKSDIRHPYTNAKFIRKYAEEYVRDLGNFKESVDQQTNRPLQDTINDLVNNEYGINLGLRYPNAPDIFLFDNVLQHSNLPVPARNNTLYGYIDNLPDTKEDLDKLNKQNESQLFRYLINPIDKYENK